ncbi:putative uncharacterized protein [Tetragenococcus halophilus subsp. halophilus]|jgi:hypothetical protein|uniref:hypothetical protein n=1 Tax=Lactobacillales TaxID=186826 RepID=UPI000CAB01A2|nr:MULTISPECIES: hypothetical protein [Lactobacillales]MCT3573683.1 hypothetical protein [Levilactobacillus brevis]MDE1535508.1 hypothetical protein [Lactobacillus gasseri]RND69441.1 hypothetical protein FAM18132_02562 [Lacticaseibacillus paracasei]GBD80906.1 putative uncharacterized protein [Tetragenococcus halophilus subsp. halophilus]GBD83434.1 putative uncharacterized protein [Tetragenococcus halophilus subsp. halophilus]
MTKREFKKAVDTNKLSGLSQPKKFMNNEETNKQWQDYSEAIKQEQENYEQVLYSVAVEPSLKEAIKIAGKNRGRVKGGAKSIVRDAMTSYFDKHPELFE